MRPYSNIQKLIRPELLRLKSYPASKTLTQLERELKIPKKRILKLSTAENSEVEGFYNKKIRSSFFRYPDPFCEKLRQSLSEYTGFPATWIACGNGSDELIDLMLPMFVAGGEEVILCPPTFPMYLFCCRVRGVRVKSIPRDKSLNLSIKKIRAAISKKTKLVFIDSPGNPSGVSVGENDLLEILKQKIIVVVDEAYFEYSGKTFAPLVKKFPNLIILRSFSKWAGLAGLRLGYLIANPQIIKTFLLIKPPYNVNSAAQEIGMVALGKRGPILKEMKKFLKIKQEMVSELSKFKNFQVIPGEGSYILVKLKKYKLGRLLNQFEKVGVLLKQVNQTGLNDGFLVSPQSSVKTRELVTRLKLII